MLTPSRRASWIVLAALALALAPAGCGDDAVGSVEFDTTADLAPAIGGIAALTNSTAVDVVATADPVAAAVPDRDLRVAIVVDLTCVECYRIDAGAHAHAWVVHAGDLLGAQYGAAAMLEHLGFRFRSPYDSYRPWAPSFDPAAEADLGVTHTPETRVRGLQLHTIHPIESYFALWEPGHTDEADRIFSWIVANRGNFVQWVALADITDPTRHAEWQAQTATLIEHAHARGLRTGLNVQLYAHADKQNGFNLDDDVTGTPAIGDQLAANLPLVTDGLPFDVYDLSFGEFATNDPQTFIDDVDASTAAIHAAAPAAEVHAVVHVGENLRVTYMGQDLIYYFLVKFCDPSIVPDIHTVMFYDLYEDAGGAYSHQDFSEHRAYLLDRISAGQPAAYFPEDAYWVAFDDSVPLYLPLYVRSRWLDLERVAADPGAAGKPLDEQLVFSSGWEWGYWLNDYASLRASYERPADYRDLIAHAFAGDLDRAVDDVVGLTESEHDQLLTGRLVAYLAGRDVALDAARDLNIVSQPDRVTFADLAAMDDAGRGAFAGTTMVQLDALATDLAQRASAIDGLDIGGAWADELRDGVDLTALRARFVDTAYHASLAHLAAQDDQFTQLHDQLVDLLGKAGAITAHRHGAMHSPDADELTSRGTNHTLYQYGYLYNADTLCYWTRELRQIEQQSGMTVRVPDCLL